MTDLFDILPSTLFNPLAARGAPVYVQVLLRLFDETHYHNEPLSRELALYIVAQVLNEPEALRLTEDATSVSGLEAETDVETSDSWQGIQARATAILRYLQKNGWLREEAQQDHTRSYILPDYAFRLLRVLREIVSKEALPLAGLICSIHDLLQATVRDGNAHIRLPEAHRQTLYLLNGLKELQHNIGRHIEQVLHQLEARAVLKQFFLHYRDEIVDRVYHQLRTTDHLSRFRPAILESLTHLEQGEEIQRAAERMRMNADAPTVDAAASQLLRQIQEIRDHFEGLDRLLQAIDMRHGQFVASAVRTVELHLTASSTTSGQLYTILSHLLEKDITPANDPLPSRYASLVNLFHLSLIDSDSLAPPSRAAIRFVPEPVATPRLSDKARQEAIERTRHQLTRAISRQRVRRFAEELLRERDEIRGAEISLAGSEELPLLIYLRTYGDGSLGYIVQEVDNAQWIERDGVGFRDFVLRKKSKE